MIWLWTDGGCKPNPGLGSWAYVLMGSAGSYCSDSGAVPCTTNNRMELRAVVEGLLLTTPDTPILVYTDSNYVKRGITEWIPIWVERGWTRKEGELKNVDLWQTLYRISLDRSIKWDWVKGHSGNENNELCHKLAKEARLHAEREQGF